MRKNGGLPAAVAAALTYDKVPASTFAANVSREMSQGKAMVGALISRTLRRRLLRVATMTGTDLTVLIRAALRSALPKMEEAAREAKADARRAKKVARTFAKRPSTATHYWVPAQTISWRGHWRRKALGPRAK